MKIGVLALQGDFAEHLHLLKKAGIEGVEIRLPEQLDDIDGLILPGGESTTFGKLAEAYHFMEPLRQFGREKPMWGTCAGAIFMAKEVHRDQPLLELMDISIERNAFGRQVASFEVGLKVSVLGKVKANKGDENLPFHAIFIRAPLIESVWGNAQVLAKLDDGRIVAAQQGHLLATSFHPELTNDDRFHRYFLRLVERMRSA